MVFRDYQDFPEVKDLLPQQSKSSTSIIPKEKSNSQLEKGKKLAKKAPVVVEHVDIIQDEFWVRRPWILGGR